MKDFDVYKKFDNIRASQDVLDGMKFSSLRESPPGVDVDYWEVLCWMYLVGMVWLMSWVCFYE